MMKQARWSKNLKWAIRTSKFSVKISVLLQNLPGWVELEGGSLVGAVNQEVTGGLKIIKDENREKYPVEASDKNVITFSDEEGKAFYSFKVSYDGMTPGVMELTLPSTYPTNWVVSMDGKTFTQKVRVVVLVILLYTKECHSLLKL